MKSCLSERASHTPSQNWSCHFQAMRWNMSPLRGWTWIKIIIITSTHINNPGWWMWTISNDHQVTCLKRFLNPHLWSKRFYVLDIIRHVFFCDSNFRIWTWIIAITLIDQNKSRVFIVQSSHMIIYLKAHDRCFSRMHDVKQSLTITLLQ